MDEFYGTDISENDQMKIMGIREAMPEDVRGFIQIEQIQNLLKADANELETQITALCSELELDDVKQIQSTCKAVKEIIHPSQTTKINNNNINIVNVNVNSIERSFIDQIKVPFFLKLTVLCN